MSCNPRAIKRCRFLSENAFALARSFSATVVPQDFFSVDDFRINARQSGTSRRYLPLAGCQCYPAGLPAQLDLLYSLDELHKAFRLRLEPLEQLGIFQAARVVEQVIDLGQEDPLGKQVGIPIAENGLELLDWPQRAPYPGAQAREADRPFLEALRELEHVYEVFHYAGDTAVVFGRDHVQPRRPQDGVGERQKGLRLLRVGGRGEYLGRELGEIEDVQGHFERGVDFLDVPGHLAGIAARAVGANDEGDHAGTIARRAGFGKRVRLEGWGQGCIEGQLAGKSSPEIRKPKTEIRRKSEFRSPNQPAPRVRA